VNNKSLINNFRYRVDYNAVLRVRITV